MKAKAIEIPGMICCGQVKTASWCQEWYETASRDARKRAAHLRKCGYAVRVSSMGTQLTSVGDIKMTLVDIRPGANADMVGLPEVRVESAWAKP